MSVLVSDSQPTLRGEGSIHSHIFRMLYRLTGLIAGMQYMLRAFTAQPCRIVRKPDQGLCFHSNSALNTQTGSS